MEPKTASEAAMGASKAVAADEHVKRRRLRALVARRHAAGLAPHLGEPEFMNALDLDWHAGHQPSTGTPLVQDPQLIEALLEADLPGADAACYVRIQLWHDAFSAFRVLPPSEESYPAFDLELFDENRKLILFKSI